MTGRKFKINDLVTYIGAPLQGVPQGQVGVIKRITNLNNHVCFDAEYPDNLIPCSDDSLELTDSEHPAAASGAKREKLNVLPYDLVPFQEMTDAFTRVAEFGAKKYEPWNWSKGLARVQLIGSLLRHTFAYLRGEERDADSGLLHTDHILWNAAALAHNVHHNLEDGRRPEPKRDYHG